MSSRLQWREVTSYGLFASVAFSILVLGSYVVDPLMWVGDFPPEVRARVDEIPPASEQRAVVMFFAIVALLLGVTGRLGYRLRRLGAREGSFGRVFVHLLLVLTFVNLWDFLVVDLLVFNLFHPDFMLIPGAEEEAKRYATAWFHFEASLHGTPIFIGMALIVAAACRLLVKSTPVADGASA
ncbi:MAG: hypothetical protein AAGF11_11570 [Myxococcota bacterium]